MANLRIPLQNQPAILKLLSLSSEEFESIVNSLDGAPLTLGFDKLALYLSSRVKGIPALEIESVIGIIITLHFVQINSKLPTLQVANDILSAIEGKIPNLTQELRDLHLQRLVQILSDDRFKGFAKVIEIASDHERSLTDVRMMTEIRPIFGDNPDAAPAKMSIVHTLKLTYREAREQKSFYIALDNDDIVKMKSALERAEKKNLSIRQALAKIEIPFIDSE